MKKIYGIVFAIVLGIGAYFIFFNETKQDDTDIKKLVEDYSIGEREALSASITSDQLIVTSNQSKETTYDLPADEFFVSIAPYIDTTHPCAIHNLTGCQGELTNKEFNVYIENQDGQKVLEDTITSHANGFIDLWLPRDQTYKIKITYEGKTVESEFSTFKGDDTCISTMQLS